MSYHNAPLLEPFGILKEDTTKFITSWYHKGKFRLPKPIEITPRLIVFVIGLPAKVDLVLLSSKKH